MSAGELVLGYFWLLPAIAAGIFLLDFELAARRLRAGDPERAADHSRTGRLVSTWMFLPTAMVGLALLTGEASHPVLALRLWPVKVGLGVVYLAGQAWMLLGEGARTLADQQTPILKLPRQRKAVIAIWVAATIVGPLLLVLAWALAIR